MKEAVLLDAGVVTRCRRRVHLEHDPTMVDAPQAPPDPAAGQRQSDAAEHRLRVRGTLAALHGADWVDVPATPETTAAEAEQATLAAMRAGAKFIGNARLPIDRAGGRRGRIDLLIRADGPAVVGSGQFGYRPVLVVRHKITDPGSGARTSPLLSPSPGRSRIDQTHKPRSQPRDQLRLAHLTHMLRACGFAAPGRALGGVIGVDADLVLWHDLEAPTWPGGRTALGEYDLRFADRLAVARAAAAGEPALAQPSRILDCRSCPWWPVCGAALAAARDVSLVLRGEDANALRQAGVRTVDELAAVDPAGPAPATLVGAPLPDAVALARAWLADLALVRRTVDVPVPRGDVELDIDMESFGDSGAYLWGCLLSGVDIGFGKGYRPFVTWQPLPTVDEARSFAEFWAWLKEIRAAARRRGLTFRAYCYNELAENRWLLASADRFAGRPGVPSRVEVREFINSDDWVDLFRVVSTNFLCPRGKGLKTVAPVAGFAWRDPHASGENSMRWYRDAVALDGGEPRLDQRQRLLEYNEDDVRATWALRGWMSSAAVTELPYLAELLSRPTPNGAILNGAASAARRPSG
ncbi:MAG TPA: TM0106 family RecB-like putative nuclease [Pseudonocardiaceae bacterium]|nr:TM0106 family RecB-like putative nuclease [Pseudonocardiaceae bacterium]